MYLYYKMIYKCRRCGYFCDQKNDLRKHFNRKNVCNPDLENIDVLTLKQELEKKKKLFCENSVKICEKSVKICENSVKTFELSNCKKNNQYCSNGNVKIINDKYQCSSCKKLFKEFKYLDEHQKKNCKMLIHHNNIYTFDTETFGKTKYGNGGGDVYIVQTDFSTNKLFKIGVTTCIYNRLKHYRCGSVLEPRLHFYYPFKNIKKADKDLKLLLYKYNVKREIYSGELETFQNIIMEYQKSECETKFEIEPKLKDSNNLRICEYCHLYFFDAKSLCNHKNICEKNIKRINEENEVAALKAQMAQKEAEMSFMKEQKEAEMSFMKEEMEKQKEYLMNQIEILMKRAGNNNNNTINTDNSTNIENQINIHINGFGKEDLSYITDRHFREWFNGPFSAIPNLVEYIHFNPKKPQNWNAKIPDDKTSKALIYNAEKEMWVKREKKEVINDMVEKSYNMLDTNFEIQKEAKTLDEKGKRKFENFMKIYDKGDKQLDKRYETEIREKLMNFKEYHIKNK